MPRIVVACILILMSDLLGAQAPSMRTVIDIDGGWGYTESEATAPQALDTPATSWQSVTLPHTWNALDATDENPGYRRGAGWYRRTLNLDSYQAGRRFVLYFEGANTIADVFVNDSRAGGHVGGYVGFEVDITPFIRRGNNDLRVRVDNSDNPDLIPSDRSDFVIFGGLTRDVWLEVLPPVWLSHIETTTPLVSRDSAKSHLRVEIDNPERRRGTYAVVASVRAPNGREVAVRNVDFNLVGEKTYSVAMDLPIVRNPLLWGPGHPSLYNVIVTLSRSGEIVDRLDQHLGFRWYRFEPNGPFYLNGERLLLRGTQLHEDFAGLGAAIPNARHRRDLEMIREMGANFVRLAHYPQDPEVYRAADSLGLLVWDELPWDRGGVGGDRWRANTRRLLTEQIRQNISHPSIILWSLGNEVSFIIETFNRGDTASVRAFMRELKSLAHTLDPARPTSVRQIDEVADIVDVYSPSIWAGWYRGVYADYEKALLDAHSKYPRMLHMEYGADGHYGRHSENPINGAGMRLEPGFAESVGTPVANIARNGDWSESYQTDLLDWHLMVTERQPWLAGTAQWIFRDFPTPLRPENPIPYVNQKGLFTRDGIPKDSYYVYRAYWTTSPKFVYIVSHTWNERSGRAGKPVSVRVYSNCSSVDLSVNGKSQGARTRIRDDFPSQGLRWNVNLSEGRNSAVAICAGAGDAHARDSVEFNYTTVVAGRPSSIVLGAKQLPNGHLLVEARLVDANGRQSIGAADRLYFNAQGAGRLMVDLGTPTGSSVIQAANGYAAIEFVPPPAGMRATIIARTQEINGGRLDLVGSSVVPSDSSIPSRDVASKDAHESLIRSADSALTGEPPSVTQKHKVPPSGDKHDFMSMGTYWWPDTTKPGGLPYIRRDGVVNPEIRIDDDGARFQSMVDAVRALALARYYTGDPRYSSRGATVLHAWFVDPATRMNPNMRYAQAIPGVTDGRGIGIIDTRNIAQLLDAVRLLQKSSALSDSDLSAIVAWSRAYLAWLLQSKNGKDEQAAVNNHGTWYDVQVVSLALFTGDTTLARRILMTETIPRIGVQIRADGSQPLELERTRPMHYSAFNLDAYTQLAEMGTRVGVDLWKYEAPSGGSLRKALLFLATYADPSAKWLKPDVTPVPTEEFAEPYRRADVAIPDPRFSAVLATLSRTATDSILERALHGAAEKLRRSATSLDPANGYPRFVRAAGGSWEQQSATQWTSGFFAGTLWYMYELTRRPEWKDLAEKWTAGLESNKSITSTHDLGFMIFNSFGHGYLLTGNPHYKEVVLDASRSLATRYNPRVGAIKSWNTERATDRRATWKYPVIIDNLMNLELLFWSAANGGDPAWKNMAEQHALTSARAHVRADGSTAHVALFDPTTGALENTVTWQGYSDSSAWARGQAWAINGFTNAYARTGRPELLAAAQKTADYFISHLPADGIPYWDFRDPGIPNVERDASAAAIAASGLLDLARRADSSSSARYRNVAEKILLSLARDYTAGPESAAILAHSVGGRPQNSEVDVGIVYADYYYVEALLRLKGL